MRFSQRIGKTEVREALQIESIDKVLENKLWNIIYMDFFDRLIPKYTNEDRSLYEETLGYIWTDFFLFRIDEIPGYSSINRVSAHLFKNYINEWFSQTEWFHKYDFIEFIATITEFLNEHHDYDFEFSKSCNFELKRQMAGYRLIDNKIVQITAEEEIVTIEEAINETQNNAVETHLIKALEFLSNRTSPDYRNSVKESISAIEAYCCFMLGDPKATLGKAINRIEKIHALHPAYKDAFSKLYGYTSDEGGIRHALTDDGVEVAQEDARFMLVTCSAFINYLKVMNSKTENLKKA